MDDLIWAMCATPDCTGKVAFTVQQARQSGIQHLLWLLDWEIDTETRAAHCPQCRKQRKE
jgi:hypothetical protein